MLGEKTRFQGGIRLILSVLRSSEQKVVLHTGGSCRDVAAAFNREPELFRQKVRAVYIDIGNGSEGLQDEWNVKLDPAAFARLVESGLPVYWCPCFGKAGYQTFYKADQSLLLRDCTPPVVNFFVYCLSRSKDDPLAFLDTGPHPLPAGNRNMWCTAGLLHAAGRKIYERGSGDFVALSPADAARAGLADRAVEAFQFVPVEVQVEPPKSAASVAAAPLPRLHVTFGRTPASVFLFRSTDPRYEKILASCLKSLLDGLGRK